MTTREHARQALTAKIVALKATWTEYPLEVEFDNYDTVNQSTQTHPYLCVSMVYQDGFQIALGPAAPSRVLGTIVIEAKVKAGSGTAQANRLLEHFYPGVHMTDTLAPLRTLAARFDSAPPKSGWVAQAALIPFWYDRL